MSTSNPRRCHVVDPARGRDADRDERAPPATSLPAGAGDEPAVEAAPVVLSGALSAPDSRLKRGCKSYAYAYSVTTDSEDWTFESGVLPYRLCRGATAPGRFTLTGVLTSYEGTTSETLVQVAETFRLRKRNR